MTESDQLARLLGREDLPPAFERWQVALGPGEARPTSGEEWAGAVVLVESGELEVDCLAGGSRTFVGGDVLVLGLLPLRTLRNRGTSDVRLLAVRRTGHRPTHPFLRVGRHERAVDR